MDRNTFGNIVRKPDAFTKGLKQEILAAKLKYPYCAALQLLDLMGDKACGNVGWDTIGMQKTRLYLRKDYPFDRRLSNVKLQEEKPVDILQEINSYQDVSFKTAPKSVILSNFLENEVCEGLKTESKEPLPIEVITKKSISNDKPVETETLAVIYQKQGKYEKALGIYQKLIAKYPEKSSIFASRISEINNIIETNKN